MKLNLESNLSFRIMKGEISALRKNLWICPFLKYIVEHPHANEVDICRDLFCDNGEARRAAVKNILFFFKAQGLLAYDKQNGYELTSTGLKTMESGNVWQGLKGAFLLTLWNPMGDMPYILDVQPVPDSWYDNAKNDPEEIPEEYGKNMENLTVCSDKTKLVSTGKTFCSTYTKMEFKADLKSNGMVKVFGTPALRSLASFEVTFQIDDELKSYLMDDDDDEDNGF
ncbi:hypothetical protein [Fibrobacter sp. UWB10]|jgi:hypothetical protein|uniref:hypothetical protein n=1 Tax=Fibrobacter sp. UWB10 TaxID=1896201 RepID=UPI00156B0437|nr:hypothetical protein [Fibrobacter sp. UWB10]SMP57690.1 hypothetical protein SAMN05720465_2727 [Fibrobacter sp. UWB10]